MAGLTTHTKRSVSKASTKMGIVKAPGYKKGGPVNKKAQKKVKYLQSGGVIEDDIFGLGAEVKGLDTTKSYFTDDGVASQFGTTGKTSNGSEGKTQQSTDAGGIVGILQSIGGIGGDVIDIESQKKQTERQTKLQTEIDKTRVDTSSQAALYRSLVAREKTRTEGFEEALGSKNIQAYSAAKAFTSGKGTEFMAEMDAIKSAREGEGIRSEKAEENLRYLGESAIREAQASGDEDFRLLVDGGKVMGKGTSKSDSIKGKIPSESFIVPAENAKVAETLREMFFHEKGTKKANLKSGGVPVKLSKGEHMFTPEEVDVLLGAGVNLDALAPNAKEKIVPGANLQDGSTIEGLSKVENIAYKFAQEEISKYKVGTDTYNDLNDYIQYVKYNVIGTDTKRLTKEKAQYTGPLSSYKRTVIFNRITPIMTGANKEHADDLKPDQAKIFGERTDKVINKEIAEEMKQLSTPSLPKKTTTGPPKRETAEIPEKIPTIKVSPEDITALIKEPAQEPVLASQAKTGETPQERQETGLTGKEVRSEKKGFKLPDVDVTDVLAVGQIGAAVAGLAKEGERPVGEVSPELLGEYASVSDLKSAVEYPIAQIERDIEEKRKRLSVPTTGERSFEQGKRFAAGTEAQAELQRTRERKATIEGTSKDRFTLAKAGLRTGLARSIASEKRALFEDKLSSYEQSQTAWGNLLQTGIANIIGSQQSKKFSKELAAIEGDKTVNVNFPF